MEATYHAISTHKSGHRGFIVPSRSVWTSPRRARPTSCLTAFTESWRSSRPTRASPGWRQTANELGRDGSWRRESAWGGRCWDRRWRRRAPSSGRRDRRECGCFMRGRQGRSTSLTRSQPDWASGEIRVMIIIVIIIVIIPVYFSAMNIAESSKEPGYGEETADQRLSHSHSASQFRSRTHI